MHELSRHRTDGAKNTGNHKAHTVTSHGVPKSSTHTRPIDTLVVGLET